MALTPRQRAVVASTAHAKLNTASGSTGDRALLELIYVPFKATDADKRSALELGRKWKRNQGQSWEKSASIIRACGCEFDDRRPLPWDPKARRCLVVEHMLQVTMRDGRMAVFQLQDYVRELNESAKGQGQIDRKMLGHLLVWADAIGAISWQPGWDMIYRGVNTDDKFFDANSNPDVTKQLNAASYGHVVKAVVHRTGKTKVELEATNLGAFQMGLATTPADVKKLAKQAAKFWGWKLDGDVIDTQPAAGEIPPMPQAGYGEQQAKGAPKPATKKQAPARKAAEVKQPAPAAAEAEDMAKTKAKKAPAKKAPAKKAAKKATKKATAKKATAKKATAKKATAKKATAKKATAKKATAKKAVKKTAKAVKKAVKKVAKATKKATAKKAPAKKATAKKVTKKAAPKKAPAKKKPAKKAAVAVVSVPSLTGSSGGPLVQPELPMIEVEKAPKKPAKKKPAKKAPAKKPAKKTTKKAATKKAATKKAPAKKAPAGKARAGASARAKKPEEKKKMAATTTPKKKPSKAVQIRRATERLAKLTSPTPKKPAKASAKTAKVAPGRYTGPGGQKIAIKRVWSNPVMNTTSMVIALTATAVGYGVADMLDRWIATRAQDEGKDAKPMYGVAAAKAIRTKPDGMRIAAQLGFAAASGAGAYFTNDRYPYVSFGLGGLAVGAGIKFIELFMKGTLLPAMFKAAKPTEESFSNRLYADLQDWTQQGTTTATGAMDGVPRNAGFLGTPPFPGRSPRAQAVGPVATGTVGCGTCASGAYDLSKLFPGSGSFDCSDDGKDGCGYPPGIRLDIPTGNGDGNGGGRVPDGGGGGGREPGGGNGGGREPGDGGGSFTPPPFQRTPPQPPRFERTPDDGRERPPGVPVPSPDGFTPPRVEQRYQPPRFERQPSSIADLMFQFHKAPQVY